MLSWGTHSLPLGPPRDLLGGPWEVPGGPWVAQGSLSIIQVCPVADNVIKTDVLSLFFKAPMVRTEVPKSVPGGSLANPRAPQSRPQSFPRDPQGPPMGSLERPGVA